MRVLAPDPAEYWALSGISAVSPSDVRASGWVSNGTPHVYSGGLLEYWNGQRWELRLGHRIPFGAEAIDAQRSGSMIVGRDRNSLWGHDGRWTEVRSPTLPHLYYLETRLSDVVWTSGTKAWRSAPRRRRARGSSTSATSCTGTATIGTTRGAVLRTGRT